MGSSASAGYSGSSGSGSSGYAGGQSEGSGYSSPGSDSYGSNGSSGYQNQYAGSINGTSANPLVSAQQGYRGVVGLDNGSLGDYASRQQSDARDSIAQKLYGMSPSSSYGSNIAGLLFGGSGSTKGTYGTNGSDLYGRNDAAGKGSKMPDVTAGLIAALAKNNQTEKTNHSCPQCRGFSVGGETCIMCKIKAKPN